MGAPSFIPARHWRDVRLVPPGWLILVLRAFLGEPRYLGRGWTGFTSRSTRSQPYLGDLVSVAELMIPGFHLVMCRDIAGEARWTGAPVWGPAQPRNLPDAGYSLG
jgi:hypothetical protein